MLLFACTEGYLFIFYFFPLHFLSKCTRARARNDVDTVLTPSAMFKRFLRRAVVVAVILAIALIVVASWKRGKPHDGASAAQPPGVEGVPVTGGNAVLPVLTTPPNAPNRATGRAGARRD